MQDRKPLRTKIKITVLLIDDEKKLLEALSGYLESKGIVVLSAQSTKQALQILKHKVPDLLIVDVIMPEQTGYEFITRLKRNKHFTTIPFIFLTAKGMTKDRIEGYRLGCRAYITKPFDPEELISVIDNIIIETKNIDTHISKSQKDMKYDKFKKNLQTQYGKTLERWSTHLEMIGNASLEHYKFRQKVIRKLNRPSSPRERVICYSHIPLATIKEDQE